MLVSFCRYGVLLYGGFGIVGEVVALERVADAMKPVRSMAFFIMDMRMGGSQERGF